MQMLDSVFTFHYPPRLREIFARLTQFGAVFANLVSPAIILYLLAGSIPDLLLTVWGGLNILLFGIRVALSRMLYRQAYMPHEAVIPLLKTILAATAFSALLHGSIIWIAVLSGIDDLHIFIVSLAVVSLSTGAVSTLVSLFLFYLSYVLIIMIPLIAAILYHGGDLFNIFAFLLTFLTASIIVASHRQFILLRDAIAMEETFKTIFDQSADGIMIMEEDHFTDCNEAFVSMFRFPSKEELLRQGPTAIMPRFQPDGALSMEKMFAMIHRAQAQKENPSFEWLHHRHNGEPFWAEIVLRKIYLYDREVLHGTWRDISERKQLEAEWKESRIKIENLNQTLEQRVADEVRKNREMDHRLLQQSRLAQMGEMISMIAHQWRQPLSAISVTSGLLSHKAKQQTLDFETSIELSDKISGYAQHLSQTINDFRNFFKPHTGKGRTNYDEIVAAVLEIINVSIVDNRIDLQTDLQCHDPFLCYPNELKQVLLNLIKNAEDALVDNLVEHPFILIQTYTKGGDFLLEVHDNGGGINPQDLRYIFDPYFSTKEDKNGTGLGLYMSKIIIEEHCKGTLGARNTPEGICFTITLRPGSL